MSLGSATLLGPLQAAGGENAGDKRCSLAVGESEFTLLRGHGLGRTRAARAVADVQRRGGCYGLGTLELAQARWVADLR